MTDIVTTSDDGPGPGISSSDLLRACGGALDDRRLWADFESRFQRRILLYLLRACRLSRGHEEEVQEVVLDLAQLAYIRLIQNDGRMLRSFRGNSDFAVWAFLARIASSVVADHFRYRSADKRQAQVISIDDARQAMEGSRAWESDAHRVNTILSLIDVDRALENDGGRRHGARDRLVFKLHYVDGFTSAEIAAFPGFQMGRSAVEAVLSRMRKQARG